MTAEHRTHEPSSAGAPGRPDPGRAVAIVGMAVRLPGAGDLAQFWELLTRGGDAVTVSDRQRRPGGYLRDVTGMDTGFFAIAATEAAAMDPQQRLLLELAWEAVEDSRTSPHDRRGAPVGVYIGAMHGDYELLSHAAGESSRHTLTGLNRGMLANRISHFLGLRGPSLTVDAGQASSLVAVHLAVRSIRLGECESALAGGVNLALSEDETRIAEEFGALSPDHACHLFDERANGYVRGEGGALVALKPLTAALADGDRIYAVIHGSAVNNDGATSATLTAPSADAQADVLRAALADAGVEPDRVGYVELHGTGTPVGDPIEAAALGSVYGTAPGRAAALRVGSVKTNIGHLEGAAGIAGLVKAALVVHRGEIPASRNHERPNPRIPLSELGLQVVPRHTSWPGSDPVVAGVSSFGMGGTNCHIVVSAAEPVAPVVTASPPPGERLTPFVLTGASPGAVRDRARQLSEVVTADTDLDALAYSLHATRARHDHRVVVLGRDHAGIVDGFAAVAADSVVPHVVSGRRTRTGRGAAGKLAFVFPGQGAQRPAMARALYRTLPGFAEHLDTVVAHFTPHLDLDLRRLLIEDDAASAESLGRTRYTQPALFTVEYALYLHFRDLGIRPDHLIGHSIGELVAATASGAFELPDAVRLVAERGRLMQAAPAGGAMIAIGASEDEIRAYRDDADADFDIAAVNHRLATVVSGDVPAVAAAGAEFARRGYRTTRLAVSHAFHSAHMDPVLAEFRDVVADIAVARLTTPVVSNTTGQLLTDARLAEPDYLTAQLRGTVRFGAGIETLLDHGVTTFLELGPGAGLSSTIRTAPGIDAGGRTIAAVPALRDGTVDADGLLRVLAELECAGADVRWERLVRSRRRIDLPTYPFQRTPQWLNGALGAASTVLADSADISAGTQEIGGQGPASVYTRSHAAGFGKEAGKPHVPAGASGSGRGDGATPHTPDAASGGDRHGAVATDAANAVVEALSRALGSSAVGDDELRSAFTALGMDSLGSVQFRDTVAELTGLSLPASLVYDYPTPRAVIDHIGDVLDTPTPEAHSSVNSGGAQTIRSDEDDVVIVAAAGRWPGGLGTPEEFWDALLAGEEFTGAFPTDRGWDVDTRMPTPGPARSGGFLYDAAEFDAAFFGIGPREAEAMDPQQRLLLESTWTCLQRAGVAPSSLRGSATGVYIGAVQQEYGPRMHEAATGAAGYLLTGTTNSVISGRLAYHFGFTGPAVTVDTACSSSLVALHLAVRGLRSGECDLAVVGGVCVMATPGMFTEFARQGGLAADGHCKPFADGADGTVWAEAVATLLVQRRSDAVRSGHRILAVVRGTAINSDGASNGLTAPNGLAQRRVIEAALADARLSPGDIDVVEAHGTGTALGDPIEARALGAVYGSAHSTDRPVLIGSAKSNIGHTQAAAGITGVIKLIGALGSATVPPTVNLTTPSGLIDWSAAHLRVPVGEPVPWPDTEGPRTAAISSFGISGTNAHVILQEPGVTAPRALPEFTGPVVFSARTAASLRAHATALAEAIDAGGTAAGAAESHRVDEGFAYRAVVRASTDIGDALAAVAAGAPHPDSVVAGPPDRVGLRAYVFSGQGSQRVGMGARLAATVPAFAAQLTAVIARLDPYLPVPLATVLADESGLVHRTRYTQPAIFAVEVALFRWLETIGPRTDFVAGHSVGELAAAHVAGVLSLDDACRLVTARGRLMDEIDADGTMAALAATEAEVAAALPGYPGVDIAAVNGPRSTVISGDRAAVEALAEAFRSDGRKVRQLEVSHAFHSAHMDAMVDEFRRIADSVPAATPRIPLVSGLTGTVISSATEWDGDHWVRHARRAVRFADVVRTLYDAGVRTFLEVGPDAVLLPMITESAAEPVAVVPTLTRRADETVSVTQALETLYLDGAEVRWPALLSTRPVDTTALPGYAFTRARFWSTPDRTDHRHPFLGAAARSADGATLLTGTISLDSAPWLADHTIGGAAIFPGTGFLDLALYAADRAGADRIIELDLTVPMILGDSDRVVEISVAGEGDGEDRELTIRSHAPGEQWVTHATGRLGPDGGGPDRAAGELPVPHADPEELYRRLAADGYRYGPAFRNLRRFDDGTTGPERLRAHLELDRSTPAAAAHRAHPALLDAALHPLVVALSSDESGPVLPAQFRGVRVAAAPTGPVLAEATRTGRYRAALRVSAPDGRTLVEIDAVTFLPATLPAAPGDERPGRLVWHPGVPVGTAPDGDVVVVGGADGDFATPVALRAAVRGGRDIPDLVVALPSRARSEDLAAATHHGVAEMITVLRDWAGDDRFAETPLAIVVENPGDGAPGALPGHAVAGLVRSAQHEWPGRFRLVETDTVSEPRRIAAAAQAVSGPEIMLRDNHIQQAAVEAVPVPDESRTTGALSGTVLVTGASGALAGVVCRHLVTTHGVTRLLLVSRGGVGAPAVARLRELGAQVRSVTCDIAVAEQVRELIDGIDPDAPLSAVFHLAGVLDDAALINITPEQITTVLRPKVDGAWNLHRLTERLPRVGAFVLFSSMVAITGNPGQGTYGAANAFLDGLARFRHRAGLPATAIGWGFWEDVDGMGSTLTGAELARLRRSGVGSLTPERAVRYLDAALASGDPHVLATSAWQAAIRVRSVRSPVPASTPDARGERRAAEPSRGENRWAALSSAEREQAVVALVRDAVAQSLGYSSGGEVDARRGFLDMGVDSLAAVELRNQLSRACGVRLSATALIDYPTVDRLGEHVIALLTEQLGGPEVSGRGGAEPSERGAEAVPISTLIADLERVRQDSPALEGGQRELLLAQLRRLTAPPAAGDRDPGAATDDELFDLIDNELGLSRDEAL
ncbi:type I polyketide synthase [Nocardia sp. NPDC052254]|uniref:type I polyketide synthase n=1 Tax=Nocardia sp. NPDC052254 TaxID=3155681 RepID=UPI0034281E35